MLTRDKDVTCLRASWERKKKEEEKDKKKWRTCGSRNCVTSHVTRSDGATFSHGAVAGGEKERHQRPPTFLCPLHLFSCLLCDTAQLPSQQRVSSSALISRLPSTLLEHLNCSQSPVDQNFKIYTHLTGQDESRCIWINGRHQSFWWLHR